MNLETLKKKDVEATLSAFENEQLDSTAYKINEKTQVGAQS